MVAPLSVVIALSDALVADALYASLQRSWRVFPPERTLPGLERALRDWHPGLALIGIELEGHPLLDRLAQLTSANQSTYFVVCERHLQPAIAEFALLHGARDTIDYSVSLEHVRTKLAAPWSAQLKSAGSLESAIGAPTIPTRLPLEALSFRERQLLLHLQAGRSHGEAADRMGISRKTEEYYSRGLRRKFGFPARQAVDYGRCAEWEGCPKGD